MARHAPAALATLAAGVSPPLVEHTIVCPSCWESCSVLIDLSAGDHVFVEDCQVCCNPMQLTVTIGDGELLSLDAEAAQ
jgi:Cysteine-rich CPXCG